KAKRCLKAAPTNWDRCRTLISRNIFLRRSSLWRVSGFTQQRVGFFKTAGHLFAAALLFQQRFRVPLTARHAEEIAAINVERAGQLWNRIAYGMDNVTAQRLGVLFPQRPRAGGFHQAIAPRHTPPKNIVFAPGIEADNGPHL